MTSLPGLDERESAALQARIAQAIAEAFPAPLGPEWSPLPHQVPPPGDWEGWLLMAGRGSGKTDACAAYVVNHVRGPACMSGSEPHRIGIVAPTLGDASGACYSGPSGIRAHDPTARLVSGIGGAEVRWPNGSTAKLFGTNTKDDVDRLRAGGNRSLAIGTLIRTEHGERPIESVRAGDLVWTEAGLRPVLASWDHGLRPIWEIRTAAGRVLRLTPDHKMWVEGQGWTRADALTVGCRLTAWNGAVTAGSGEGRTGRARSSGRGERVQPSFCTVPSTSTTTALYRRVRKCTTPTTISRTTTRQTSSSEHLSSTSLSTVTSAAPTGTLLVGASPSGTPYPSVTANSAGSYSRGTGSAGTAPRRAGGRRSRASLPPVACGHVSCAAAISTAPVVLPPLLAHDAVVTILPGSDVEPVWDLTVAGEHDFFASDLLSHNCLNWLEELAAWRYLDDAYDQMSFGLRSGPRPRWIASTTPKPRALIKKFYSGVERNIVVTHATTYDNPHLPEHIRDKFLNRYAGLAIGAQELEGRIVEQDENALWKRTEIEKYRLTPEQAPDMKRITVGVDPSGGAGEQGIVVVGKQIIHATPEAIDQFAGLSLADLGRDIAFGFVLDDRTCRLEPDGWGRRAVTAAVDWQADDICVEINYGGAMAKATIVGAADAMGMQIPVRVVTASRGKRVRAEPVAALATRGRLPHVGVFDELEDQMATWTPEADYSPDRLDACLVAGTMILTDRGERPIEAIAPGETVWTRSGWQPVLRSTLTRRNAAVGSVTLSNGRTLRGTPEHRTWARGQWVALDALVCGDTMDGWTLTPWRSSSEASPTDATPPAPGDLTASTTRRVTPSMAVSTVRSGPQAMALYRTVTTSTTGTTTRSITTRTTSRRSHRRSTLQSMMGTWTATALSGSRTWRTFGHWRQSGIAALRDLLGTPSMASEAGTTASVTSTSAQSVGRRSSRAIRSLASSALTAARAERRTAPVDTGMPLPARSAAQSSSGANTARSPRRVPVSVVRPYAASGEADVYNLEVAGRPEYVAGGVIVHNCVWATTHLDLVSGMFKGAGSMGGSTAAQRSLTPWRAAG